MKLPQRGLDVRAVETCELMNQSCTGGQKGILGKSVALPSTEATFSCVAKKLCSPFPNQDPCVREKKQLKLWGCATAETPSRPWSFDGYRPLGLI